MNRKLRVLKYAILGVLLCVAIVLIIVVKVAEDKRSTLPGLPSTDDVIPSFSGNSGTQGESSSNLKDSEGSISTPSGSTVEEADGLDGYEALPNEDPKDSNVSLPEDSVESNSPVATRDYSSITEYLLHYLEDNGFMGRYVTDIEVVSGEIFLFGEDAESVHSYCGSFECSSKELRYFSVFVVCTVDEGGVLTFTAQDVLD